MKTLFIAIVLFISSKLFFSWLSRRLYNCWRCNKRGGRKVISYFSSNPFGALVYYKYRCKHCGEESINFINPFGDTKSIEQARSEMIWKQIEIEFKHIK